MTLLCARDGPFACVAVGTEHLRICLTAPTEQACAKHRGVLKKFSAWPAHGILQENSNVRKRAIDASVILGKPTAVLRKYRWRSPQELKPDSNDELYVRAEALTPEGDHGMNFGTGHERVLLLTEGRLRFEEVCRATTDFRDVERSRRFAKGTSAKRLERVQTNWKGNLRRKNSRGFRGFCGSLVRGGVLRGRMGRDGRQKDQVRRSADDENAIPRSRGKGDHCRSWVG